MEYETLSVTTDIKKQLAKLKADYGYATYDDLFRDIIKILHIVIKQGGIEVEVTKL